MKEKGLIASRWVVGILFLFTGFVKGIDPIGLQYKLSDYTDALHLKIMEILVNPGSFLLPFAEFIIGISLLTGIFVRVSLRLAIFFMAIFTPLTFYIALKNPVTDCGCFGDALVITNWETFYKNILLTLLIVFLLLNRKNLHYIITAGLRKMNFVVLLILYILTVGWSYKHEPLIDFRPYKVGINISEGMIIPKGAPTDVYKNTYRYRNLITNEIKKFGDTDFPWQDTVHWKFESMEQPLLVKKGYRPPIHDFSIQTADQQDVTETLLQDSIYTFFLLAYDLEKSSNRRQKDINSLAYWANQHGYHFICLTSTAGDGLKKFQLDQHPEYEFMFTDQTTLKTMMRSNPGLMLMQKGTVIAKWAEADIPEPEKAALLIRSQMNKKLNH